MARATKETEQRVITVGVTGASGAIYAQAVLRLLDADARVGHVYLVASEAGLRLLATELGVVAADAQEAAFAAYGDGGEENRIPAEQGYGRLHCLGQRAGRRDGGDSLLGGSDGRRLRRA